MEHDATLSDGGADPRAEAGDSDALLASVIARLDRPVVLVGMMGVGKSSLGRRLAALLGVSFVDADEEIEKAAQMPIPEIFSTYGETFFRDGERRVIARLMGVSDAASVRGLDLPPAANPRAGLKVIATGGGAFVNDATRALILERGLAVWLDAELDTLVERTARKDNRPLLRQGNPREILRNLRDTRAPFYSQAPIKVMSGNMPHARTLAHLLASIDAWLSARA